MASALSTQLLTEYANNRNVALRVDASRHVISGVKVLGLESKNGRSYTPESIRQAAGLYEGKNVNVNHPLKGKAGDPRDYGDRIGHLESVQVKADGLYADLHYNPEHRLAKQLAYDAEHAPNRVGMSHNVEGKTSQSNGKMTVEAITRVVSVDLVADPATTNSLFEQEGDMPDDANAAMPAGGGVDPVAAILDTIGDKIVEIAKSDADLTTKKAQIVDLLKKQDKIKAMLSDEKAPAKKADDAPADDAPKTEALAAEVKTLREQLVTLQTENAAVKRRELVAKKLSEAKLPAFVDTADLRTVLTEARDEAAIDKLIGTIKAAAKADGRPRSVDANRITESAAEVKDCKSFVHALTH